MADVVRSTLQLGALIRWERTRRQMSQSELADLAGTGQKTISQIENGNGGAKLETVFRLLAVLGMDIQIVPRGRGVSIGDVF
jgi:HTH-type transcriptional regulator/antitoxin HipB